MTLPDFFFRRALLGSACTFIAGFLLHAAEPQSIRELRDLNKSYFPFTPVSHAEAWAVRREEIKLRVLIAAGLWPMPEKSPLNAVIHGRIERDDYTVEKVFFESLPGNFVTGNLYLPKKHGDKIPGIICPHGHWSNGRFMNVTDEVVKKQLDMGAEKLANAAHSPLQARCVQLARMGCAVFFYDILGSADNVQFCDANGKAEHRHGSQTKGFISPDAELNLCGSFQLQTWNSVRALDFITSLPYVDRSRIGCTGASGGGTQTLIVTAIDDRVTASFPCVMISTAMQGGCTCENSNYLRIGQGNIDIAALAAPRPLGMTSADDWTKELETKGFPDLKNLYTMLGVPDRVEAHFNIKFPHNYNAVSRRQMYAFFNKHFNLGLADAVLEERDFSLSTTTELSVWDATHPAPTGGMVGTAHEVAVIDWFKEQNAKQIHPVDHPGTNENRSKETTLVKAAWEVMIGYKLPNKGKSTFELGTKEDHGDYLVMRGVTHCDGRAIDGTFIYPKTWNNSAVLWLSLKGGESIINKNGDLTAPAQKLLGEGYAIVCPRLYLSDATRNPSIYVDRKTFEGYAAFHYGYNPSLFAERVGDVLAMIAMIRDSDKHRTDHILVAGMEGAGVIAAAATALAGTSVTTLATDTEGFRFANLNNVWDVNFVPGAVKYGDVPWLLHLCHASKTKVLGAGTDASGGAGAVVEALVRKH